MSITVYGKATGGEHDLAIHGDGRTTSAPVVDLNLAGSVCPVDISHDRSGAGVLVHGEIDATGSLHAVAVLGDEYDVLLDLDEQIYFSPVLRPASSERVGMRHRVASSVALASLALTTRPATVGLGAVTFIRGDVRDDLDRSHWPLSWPTRHRLLARTVAALPATNAQTHRARRLVCRDLDDPRMTTDPLENLERGSASLLDPGGRGSPDGTWHGTPGAILAIR